jgi:hypothetical protein
MAKAAIDRGVDVGIDEGLRIERQCYDVTLFSEIATRAAGVRREPAAVHQALNRAPGADVGWRRRGADIGRLTPAAKGGDGAAEGGPAGVGSRPIALDYK